jgi:uncharacterized damage-inducible protein DinB
VDAVARHRRQLAYDRWANGEVARALAAAPRPPARAVHWLAHVAAAELLWLERLLGEAQSLAVWPQLEVSGTVELLARLDRRWSDYLSRLTEAELERLSSYVNTQGQSWQSRVDDILTHVVIHSAYHRGQIAAELRGAGIDPPTTDFIHGARTAAFE